MTKKVRTVRLNTVHQGTPNAPKNGVPQDRKPPAKTAEDLYGTTITIDREYLQALGGALILTSAMVGLAMLSVFCVGGLAVFQILTDTAPLWWWIASGFSLLGIYTFSNMIHAFLERIRLVATGRLDEATER